MLPTYSSQNNLFKIEWYERKEKKTTPIRHYYEGRPLKLQFHPKFPDIFVRAHFKGSMPGWIKAYCKHKDYNFTFEQVELGKEVGWILLNWHHHSYDAKPLIAGNLMGALRKLAAKIPAVCSELKQLLLENLNIANQNLLNHSELFENIGVFYRPEEIEGTDGCLLIEHELFLNRTGEETDEEYRARIESDGCLIKVINELINPLPAPIPNESDEGNVVLEGNEYQNEAFEDGELFGSLDEEDELGALSPEDDEDLGMQDEEMLGSLLDEESTSLQEEKPKQSELPEDEVFIGYKVLDYTDKRNGIFPGQMTFL